MKILEIYTREWLSKRKVTKKEEKLILEYVREIEKLMGIKDEKA